MLFGPQPLPLIDPSIRTVSDFDVLIYRVIPRPFVDYTVPPIDVSYETGIIGRLHPLITMVKGEVQRIDLYIDAEIVNGDTVYDNLAVREDIDYTRDSLGFALHRTTTITWFLENGSAHPQTKELFKIYSSSDSMAEGKIRRGNIRLYVERKISEFLMATEWNGVSDPQLTLQLGRDWVSANRGDIDDFVEISSPNIIYSIQSDVLTSWLNNVIDGNGTTIRDFIISEIDIWGIAS